MTHPTCQICGRAIKLIGGLIAHHGYLRPGDGHQSQSCFGARWRPYEESADAIPEAIVRFGKFAASHRAVAESLRAAPPISLFIADRGRGLVTVARPIEFIAERPVSYRPGTYVAEFWQRVRAAERAAAAAEDTIIGLRRRFAAWPAYISNLRVPS